MQRLIAASACLLAGCSAVHGVRPIGKGAASVDVSLGGPITEVFSAPIPVPLTTVGATYGVTDTTDVHAAFHPTAALMFGVVAGEIGASQQLLAPKGARPRLMVDLTLVGAGGDLAEGQAPAGGFRFFAQPTLLAGWDWGKAKKQTVYVGFTSFLEPADAFHQVSGFVLGNRFGFGRSHLDVELKWLDPWASSEPIVPDFVAPGQLGAVELQFGYGFTFGGKGGTP